MRHPGNAPETREFMAKAIRMAREELRQFDRQPPLERLMAYRIASVMSEGHAHWLDRYDAREYVAENCLFAAECLGKRADTLAKRKMI